MAHGSVSNLLTAAARLHQIFNGLDLHSVLGSKRHSWLLAAAALQVQGAQCFNRLNRFLNVNAVLPIRALCDCKIFADLRFQLYCQGSVHSHDLLHESAASSLTPATATQQRRLQQVRVFNIYFVIYM